MQWPPEANTAYSSGWVRNLNPKNYSLLSKRCSRNSKETGSKSEHFSFFGENNLTQPLRQSGLRHCRLWHYHCVNR